MFQAKPFVVAAVVGSMGLLVAIAVLSSVGPPQPAFVALTHADPPKDGRGTTGEEVHLSSLDGPAPTVALGYATPDLRVIVVKVPTAALLEARAATGQPTDKWAIAHPHEPGMSLLGYNAKSTHLGCTVDLFPIHDGWRDRTPDGRERTVALMDPCHQGQWDVLAMGRNLPGGPAPRPLGVVPIALGPGTDPVILAGPTIDQERPFDAADVSGILLARR